MCSVVVREIKSCPYFRVFHAEAYRAIATHRMPSQDTAGSIVAALGGSADDAAVAAAVDAQLKG